MSETRKPAPSDLCVDCGQPRDASTYHFEAPGTNWGAALHSFRAPASPALPQSNSGEGSHVPEKPACGLCGFYSQTQLNTLLDAMARSVVEEAAKIAADEWVLDQTTVGHYKFQAKYGTVDVDEAIRKYFTPEKLTQLREAVQR